MAEFPLPLQTYLREQAAALEGVEGTVGRALRPSDPSNLVGVFPLTWLPQAVEIGQHEPVIQRYPFSIHSFIKHGDEQEGGVLHVRRAKAIREMLYRDPTFRVGFGAISEVSSGFTERAQRYAITQQRFFANEVTGTFVFLTVTELWFETESIFTGG